MGVRGKTQLLDCFELRIALGHEFRYVLSFGQQPHSPLHEFMIDLVRVAFLPALARTGPVLPALFGCYPKSR